MMRGVGCLRFAAVVAACVLLVSGQATAQDAEGEGAWAERVQVLYDAASGTVERQRIRLWDEAPGQGLEFLFEPKQGVPLKLAADGLVVEATGKIVWRVRGSASYDRRAVYAAYDGSIRDGRPDGAGRLERRSGEVFEGEWRQGRLHGKGSRLALDGSRYVGDFVAGRPHGTGREMRSDGSIYEGGFADGRRHGEGVSRLAGGTTYVSRWDRGLEVGSARPDVLADAQVGGLLRAQAGGGDAGKVDFTVTVDQRLTQQLDLPYAHGMTDEYFEIYPDNDVIIDIWTGENLMENHDYDTYFGFTDWTDAPVYAVIGMRTNDGSKVKLAAFDLVVEDSQIYRKPFLSIVRHRGCVSHRPTFSFQNNGWGPVGNGTISGQFLNTEGGDGATRSFELPVEGFDIGTDVDVTSLLQQAGVDTEALRSKRFTCASRDDLPACRARVAQEIDFGELAPFLNGEDDVSVDLRGTLSYAWADDRGGTWQQSEPFQVRIQLTVIETDPMYAEYGAGLNSAPGAPRFQVVHLPDDQQNYEIPIEVRGNRNVDSFDARLKFYADHNSFHQFRARARFEDGSERLSKPVALYYIRPREEYHSPAQPEACYLEDGIFDSME